MNSRKVQQKKGGKYLKIVIVNGQGGVGKDEFVKFCREYYPHSFCTSMIDGVKLIAKEIGWDGSKEDKDRKFLSDLKDLMTEYNDSPFMYTVRTVTLLAMCDEDKETEAICFIMAREPEDIYRWIDDFDATTVLVRREEVEREHGNHADDMVFDVAYDYVVSNNSTLEDLKEEAKTFMDDLFNTWGPNNVKLP